MTLTDAREASAVCAVRVAVTMISSVVLSAARLEKGDSNRAEAAPR
jgi:hypothetical protein